MREKTWENVTDITITYCIPFPLGEKVDFKALLLRNDSFQLDSYKVSHKSPIPRVAPNDLTNRFEVFKEEIAKRISPYYANLGKIFLLKYAIDEISYLQVLEWKSSTNNQWTEIEVKNIESYVVAFTFGIGVAIFFLTLSPSGSDKWNRDSISSLMKISDEEDYSTAQIKHGTEYLPISNYIRGHLARVICHLNQSDSPTCSVMTAREAKEHISSLGAKICKSDLACETMNNYWVDFLAEQSYSIVLMRHNGAFTLSDRMLYQILKPDPISILRSRIFIKQFATEIRGNPQTIMKGMEWFLAKHATLVLIDPSYEHHRVQQHAGILIGEIAPLTEICLASSLKLFLCSRLKMIENMSQHLLSKKRISLKRLAQHKEFSLACEVEYQNLFISEIDVTTKRYRLLREEFRIEDLYAATLSQLSTLESCIQDRFRRQEVWLLAALNSAVILSVVLAFLSTVAPVINMKTMGIMPGQLWYIYVLTAFIAIGVVSYSITLLWKNQ